MEITQILPKVVAAGQQPYYELRESDQAYPAGMWRWRVNGDVVVLERALDAQWATAESWLQLDKGNNQIVFLKKLLPAADNTLELGSAAYSLKEIHVETLVYATSVHGSWSADTDDTYYLGTATYGWKGLHLPDTFIVDDTGVVKLRNNADSAYVSLAALDITLYGANGLTLNNSHTIIDETNGIQIDDLQVGDGALAAQASNRRKLYFTEGGAGVADKLYCIMKGADDNYSAVQVAIG